MHRLFLAATLIASGCGPMVAFDQPGVPVTKLARDLKGCQAAAYNLAPPKVVQQTRWRTDYRPIPVCYRGYCDFYYDRRWVPEIYNVDVNSGARNANLLSCMANEGYLRTELPKCTAQQRNEVALTRDTQQAPLSETACVVTLKGVGPLIVDPG